MNIEAIIFDKDGTLIDFDAFWVSGSVKAINSVLSKLEREDISMDELLNSIGVEDGVADIDGLLCKGTYAQIALAIDGVLKKYGCDTDTEQIADMVLEAYNRSAEFGEILPTCENIKDVLLRLKEKGIKLAVVTTDNPHITRKCLEKLGIYEMFDRIYTDDGNYPVKPEPYCALNFCEQMGIDRKNVLMVGDTMTDVRFARNAGIGVVAVGANEQSRKLLGEQADAVIEDISHIFEVIKGDK